MKGWWKQREGLANARKCGVKHRDQDQIAFAKAMINALVSVFVRGVRAVGERPVLISLRVIDNHSYPSFM
jgi:hypothetical protein